MQETLISNGLNLMMTGMGTVVLFLAILVVLTKSMSSVILNFFPDPEPTVAPQAPVASSATAGASVDASTLNVISAAVKAHRSKRGRV